MPLNGHSLLVNQGWEGQGKGLRQDAICRPLAIPQKRTLAGLGKDRDEAFPFWDHLFTAAAKTITVKLHGDGDSSGSSDAEEVVPQPLTRTSTGLISNKRPLLGTPASSGTSTPTASSSGTQTRMSLIAVAKRESARKGLYARFFRGPILGPEVLEGPMSDCVATPSSTISFTMKTSMGMVSTSAVENAALLGEDKGSVRGCTKEADPDADSRSSLSKKERRRRREEKRLRKEERRLRKEQRKGKETARGAGQGDDEDGISADSGCMQDGKDVQTTEEHIVKEERKKKREGRIVQDSCIDEDIGLSTKEAKKKKKKGRTKEGKRRRTEEC